MALGPMKNEQYTAWTDIKKTGISGSVKYKKADRVVMVCIHVSSLTVGQYTTVGTLPEGARPDQEIYQCARVAFNSDHTAMAWIPSSGTIQVYPSSTGSAYVDFTFII